MVHSRRLCEPLASWAETELKHVLCNVLEVELPIVSEHKSGQSDEQFRKWWMDIHKVLCLDVSRGKLSKVNLVKTMKNVQVSSGILLKKEYSHNAIRFR
jgi:hypothetical protein